MFKSIVTALALTISTASVSTAADFDLSGVMSVRSIGHTMALMIEEDSNERFEAVTRDIQILDANLFTTADQVEANTRDIQILAANSGQILAVAVDTNTAAVSDLFGLYDNATRDIYRNNLAVEESQNELAESIGVRYLAQAQEITILEDRVASLEAALTDLIAMLSADE